MVVKQRYKNFIEDELAKLAAYDALRPDGHVYEFDRHSRRVAHNTKQLALKAGYDQNHAECLYWATLPHDIGKTSLPVSIWDLPHKPTEKEKALRREHTVKGIDRVRAVFGEECNTDPLLRMMLDIMENHHETLNGTGFLGRTEVELSRDVQMVCICDAFDGWSVPRAHFGNRDTSPAAVIARMKNEKAGQFNTSLLNQFSKLATIGSSQCQLQLYSLSPLPC